jgi:L-fuconolactonase
MMQIIDVHHHLWTYSDAEYGWIDDSMAALKRDFAVGDLIRDCAGFGVAGSVAVQARQTVQETEALLATAHADPFILGVVGWLPLSDPNVEVLLACYSADPLFRGVRHVVQDEPDPAFLERNPFNAGISLLHTYGLSYDILVFEHQLPAAIPFVDRHPDTNFILDHIAKPRIRDRELEPWASNLRALAKRPNVWCKLSGLVTEADLRHWTTDDLRPYVETVLEAFSPSRVMFGSDWPVCLLASPYGRWIETVKELLSGLSDHERNRIFSGTAVEAYRLDIGRTPGGER